MDKPVIAICGHGGHGKDTAAGFLSRELNLPYTGSTSSYALPEVAARFESLGRPYPSLQACYDDRANHRQLWAEVIDEINAQDPVTLYRRCLVEQRLLTGIRKRREMQAVKTAKLAEFWVWIEKPGAPPDPTQEFGPEACQLTMLNVGELEEFYDRLYVLARLLFPHVCR